jgi:hypothetical protein
MSEFTKGPWSIKNGDLKSRHMYQIVGPLHIANTAKMEDLNLVAASPDMFEALEYCLENLGDEYALPLECIREAKAALAKARGEL